MYCSSEGPAANLSHITVSVSSVLKESAHMLGYCDLLSRPSIEMNTIWEPIIKKAFFFSIKSKLQ